MMIKGKWMMVLDDGEHIDELKEEKLEIIKCREVFKMVRS